MADLSEFPGVNAGYVVELYERYRRDPGSVSPADQAVFERWRPETESPLATPAGPGPLAAARAAELGDAIRERGYLAARLDPLGRPLLPEPALEPATYGLSGADLAALPAAVIDSQSSAPNAAAAIAALRELYCGTTGYDFAQVTEPAAHAWLHQAVESRRYAGELDPSAARALLERLTQVEAFERYLQRAFPGQTRFSIEGTDALVPVLDELVAGAAAAGVGEVLVGMAHRGRLNVLAHVLGKPYAAIIAEFHGAVRRVDQGQALDVSEAPGWAGDVKYHLGGRRGYPEGKVVRALVKMPPNPSHLEYVDPVVEGMARASADDRRGPGAPRQDPSAALPVLVHGDAAFPGEGIVAETLNLSRLPGYATGGTVHIVVDNQLGFTAEPRDTRSTRFASDLAKGFEVPVVHVNADDPEACLHAARLALDFRQRFHADVLIDLVGYRRWGHNEGDEPAFTQPVLYRLIADHPTVRELYAAELERRGVASPEEAEELVHSALERLQAARADLDEQGGPGESAAEEELDERCGPWEETETTIPAAELTRLGEALTTLPTGFSPDPKIARLLQRRAAALSPGGTIDWPQAESLAFATVLAAGTPIRLTGQDTARGTFSQRHATLRDHETGAPYTPLQALPEARASFDARDSPLSEAGVLGFEYGYSVEAPEALVLWEAQYGDFVDAAQVIVDRFVASGRTKWGQTSGLVLLLPHGYEGQGPEHSSAQLERFLQLCAAGNLRVIYPTTAAQYFHLLRRQAATLGCDPRPLVALTPKSLLRDPRAGSRLAELAAGAFQPVLDDPAAGDRRAGVARLVLCAGKVYFDLTASPDRPAAVAIARLEQLYPFPADELRALVGAYPALREVVWAQEEPRNMGGWTFVAPRLRALLPPGVPLRYVGRAALASQAEGSAERHAAAQAELVAEALAALAPAALEEASRAS